MAQNNATTVRIDSLEQRIERHDEIIDKMTSAQTEMMISIAKLHTSVKILLMFVAASMGLDLTGLI
tara:strand:- start:3370 stop:3567 length:198 start_codon:yes stop_codon:yes gene_type:complete